MSLLFNRKYYELTAVGGNILRNTSEVKGFIRHIIVRADTNTTTFDFSITDGSSLELFERESVDDELNETVTIPVQSKLVLKVSGSTVDELFKIYLSIQEK